jgi:hypothetical protein
MLRHFLLLAPLLFGACAAPQSQGPQERQPTATRAPEVSPAAFSHPDCSVHVYRNKTTFHALNPEKPFLFVGDTKISRLSIGESHCLRLVPGKYTISVKEPFMFMPAHTSGAVEVEVTGTTPIYVRYAKDFGGVFSAGPVTTVGSTSRLHLVSEGQWRERQ